MTINPILEESFHVHFRTRPFMMLHMAFVAGLALVTFLVWPAQGYMDFFSSGTVPSAFQVVAVIVVLAISIVSTYAGMDRIAREEIIRYSEWLEQTNVPTGSIVAGKLLSGVIHSTVMLAIVAPFLVIAAGPAGIPLRAVFSTLLVTLLVGILCRVQGLVISLIGEERDVVRIIGSWIFLAVLYVGTVQIFEPLNPIIAVARQQSESSPLVSTVAPVPFLMHPAVPSAVYMLSVTAGLILLFTLTMVRRRTLQDARKTYA